MRQQMGRVWVMAVGMALLAAPLAGAEEGACFLIDESGRQVDLGGLCGGGNSGGSPSNGFQVQIKRRRGGIPVIDVTFNGRHTVEMLLDTGASGVTIPPSIARQISFRPEGVGQSRTAGGIVPRLLGRVDSISVAGITAQDHEVGVLAALDDVGLGLLGQSFYGDYDILIREDVVEFRRR